jgi:hypothetical protein
VNATRFDDLSRLFAERRFSRRRAVLHGVTGLATGVMAASGLDSLAAQEATPSTPAASNAATAAIFLFLQSFQSGSVGPKEGVSGTFRVTLEHGLGQTIYFSDRPARIVGVAPTSQFLDGFGFSPESPPNAALVVEDERGETSIAVVELTNPGYDEETRTATYDVIELAEFAGGAGLTFHEEPAGFATFPSSFAAAHLFIDDCHGEVVACYPAGQSNSYESLLGYVKATGMCWDQATLTCTECNPAPDVLACQAKYPTICTDASPCEVVQIAP